MHRLNSFILLLCAVACAAPALAQEGNPIYRSDARLVVLHATVVDRKGEFLTNLPQSAFKVYEDGVEQSLRIFRREDVPVSMGIVIDNSGSMRDKRRQVERAALGLVKASNRNDEVFIVNFNDEAWLDVDFTNDLKVLEEGLRQIDSRGGTAMRDAIDSSMDHLKAKAKRDKKVLIVVTDGNDNTSEITLERLVQKAQNREVIVYTIGLLDEEGGREAKRAKRALTTIAEATGGQAFFPQHVDDIFQYALDIAKDIRNQYVLAYSPHRQELDGTYRRIKVTVDGKNRPTVRTRTGYYASPEIPQNESAAFSRATSQ
ncbi:MAG: VWA domain-containing protein [bacterium]|jgi:Ca-activated chloride channel family protein